MSPNEPQWALMTQVITFYFFLYFFPYFFFTPLLDYILATIFFLYKYFLPKSMAITYVCFYLIFSYLKQDRQLLKKKILSYCGSQNGRIRCRKYQSRILRWRTRFYFCPAYLIEVTMNVFDFMFLFLILKIWKCQVA